jgi:hypothetical protein
MLMVYVGIIYRKSSSSLKSSHLCSGNPYTIFIKSIGTFTLNGFKIVQSLIDDDIQYTVRCREEIMTEIRTNFESIKLRGTKYSETEKVQKCAMRQKRQMQATL